VKCACPQLIIVGVGYGLFSLNSKRSIAEKELERMPGLAQTHLVDLRLPIKQLPRPQLEAFSPQMISIFDKQNFAFSKLSYRLFQMVRRE